MSTETPAVNPPATTTTEPAAPAPSTSAPVETSAAAADVIVPETAPADSATREDAVTTKAEEPVAETAKEEPKAEEKTAAVEAAKEEPKAEEETAVFERAVPAEAPLPIVEEESIEPIKEGFLRKSNIFGLGGSLRYYVVATAPTPLESLATVHRRNPGKARDIATAAATDKGILLAYRNKAAVDAAGQHPVSKRYLRN